MQSDTDVKHLTDMPNLNPYLSIFIKLEQNNRSYSWSVTNCKIKTLPNCTLQHIDKVTGLYQHLFYDPFVSICGFKSIWWYQFLLKASTLHVYPCIYFIIKESPWKKACIGTCMWSLKNYTMSASNMDDKKV